MDIQQFLNSGIVEKYVLGLAAPEEMDRVEQMAKEYPEVNEHICKMQNCMEEYAEMDCTRPPKHVKSRMISVSDNLVEPLIPEHGSAYHWPQTFKWGTGIAAVMVFALSGLSWVFYTNQKTALQEIAVLSTQIKHLQSDQKALQDTNELILERYAVLKDVTTRQIHLRSSEGSHQTQAVLYLNPEHAKCFINVIGLPKCPYGNEYQMWAKVNGEHVSLGVLNVDSKKKELYSVPYVKDCKGFVITLEKPGGSPIPTEENVYAYGEM